MYVKLGLVLFALEVRSPSTGRVRIAVNPSGFVIPDPHVYHVHGYVIAENAEDAQRVARVSILTMRSIEVRVPGGLTQCRAASVVLPVLQTLRVAASDVLPVLQTLRVAACAMARVR